MFSLLLHNVLFQTTALAVGMKGLHYETTQQAYPSQSHRIQFS